jgi:hypothetical protein
MGVGYVVPLGTVRVNYWKYCTNDYGCDGVEWYKWWHIRFSITIASGIRGW